MVTTTVDTQPGLILAAGKCTFRKIQRVCGCPDLESKKHYDFPQHGLSASGSFWTLPFHAPPGRNNTCPSLSSAATVSIPTLHVGSFLCHSLHRISLSVHSPFLLQSSEGPGSQGRICLPLPFSQYPQSQAAPPAHLS